MHATRIDEPRKGAEAPDPLSSDLGRTDDVPRETAGTVPRPDRDS